MGRRWEDSVKTEAEIRVMQPQATGHQEPLEAGRPERVCGVDREGRHEEERIYNMEKGATVRALLAASNQKPLKVAEQ